MHIQPITTALFEEQLERARRDCRDPVAGLFGPDSMMWEINKYALSAMQGAGRALLLQIAHPWITNAIDEHSKTRSDPVGRGNRTFTHVGRMVFGSLDQALDSARTVWAIHGPIAGRLVEGSQESPAGSKYYAREVHSSVWVHATLWDTSAMMYEMFVGPLTREQKERYYQETRRFAWLFGIPDEALPKDWDDFMAYNERMWGSDELQVNANTRELAGFLFHPKQVYLRALMKWISDVSAVTMPDHLRETYGLVADGKTRRRVARIAAAFRTWNRHAPAHLVYNPTYLEAKARLRGERADWLVRGANRLAYGRAELVGP